MLRSWYLILVRFLGKNIEFLGDLMQLEVFIIDKFFYFIFSEIVDFPAI